MKALFVAVLLTLAACGEEPPAPAPVKEKPTVVQTYCTYGNPWLLHIVWSDGHTTTELGNFGKC